MEHKKKFQVALQIKTIDEHNHVLDMETTIANSIFKYMALALNFFPFPHRIRYNPISRRFVVFRSSWLKKGICIVWQGVILSKLVLKALPNSADTTGGTLAPFVKGAYLLYISFGIAYFSLFWRKADDLTAIMNQAMELSSSLSLKFVNSPKISLVRNATYFCIGFSFAFSFMSHIFLGTLKILENFHADEIHEPVNVNYIINNNQTERSNLESSVLVHVFVNIVHFLNTANWMMSYLYVGLWGLAFRQLYSVFFWRIRAMTENNCVFNLSNEIRTFHLIGSVMDQWNNLMGLIILGGAATGVLYLVTSVEQLVTGIKNATSFDIPTHLIISYVPILAGVLMVAEVHRMAVNIGSMIKHEFGKWKGQIPSDRYMTQALQGISIVHHDIVMNNVGFKGFGFFTVSYQYVLTMLSVVITYALVAVQWFPESIKRGGTG